MSQPYKVPLSYQRPVQQENDPKTQTPQPENGNGPITIERVTALLPSAVLLPIHARQKGPIYRWPKISFKQSKRPRYQRWLKDRANTGVMLGRPSGDLCAIDIDDDQLLQAFVNLNPDLAGTLCSKGARGGQFWLRMEGDYPHCVYKLKIKDGKKWGEWRADGGQSIIRGIHPDGMNYRLLCDAPPLKIRFDEIRWPPDLILPWKNPPAPATERPASAVLLPNSDISERVRRYLAAMPASIAKQGGDDQLFKAADVLVNGFAVDPEQALPFLREYNARAEPPWPENRLRYKLAQALEHPLPDKPHGYLLADGKLRQRSEEIEHNTAAKNDGDSANDTPLPEIEHPEDNRYISRFGQALGDILAPHEFFRRFNKCVIPKKNERGEISLVEIDPLEFRALIENYCTPWKWRKTSEKKPKKVCRTITIEDARTTLVIGAYLERLRPIRAFNLVRLPGFYEGGSVRLLPVGYCPVHQTYTAPGALSYPEEIPLDVAKNFLDSLFSEFPFVGDRSRAISVVLAGALTLFCTHLFPENVIRPNFSALANAEGAGKTLLLKIAIIPILGDAPAGTAPKDEDEMRKLVGAAALAASSVFFLDNIKGHLSSPSLEALTTSPVTSFRFLGQSKLLKAEHGLTVFITGNRATFSPDLRRRTLSVELFVNEVRPESRVIEHLLDDAKLVALRPDILGALWALVRNWAQLSFPLPTQLHQSFCAWSKVVGGILEAAGYLSPGQQTDSNSGSDGDRDLNDMERLVGYMVEGTSYSFAQLVGLGHHHRLFEWIIGEANEDGDALDPKARSRFGRLLSDRFAGRLFTNGQRPVRFVLLSQTARKTYGIQST